MSSATALSWFARHEIRLAWREWLAMMTGGRRKRKRAVIGLLSSPRSCTCRLMQ